MKLTFEEKLNLIKRLNWDYDVSADEILDVIEGRKEKIGPFTKVNLFARSFQGIGWNYVVALWGMDNIKALLQEKGEPVRRSIMPALREKYDFFYAALLKKPLPTPRRCSTSSEWKSHPVLSDRWNRFIKGLL